MPLAIPSIAGPSALATVMLMVSRDPSQRVAWIVALTAAMVVATIVLLASYRLQRVLGERGMMAVERLMGLVLTALAVQMLLDGVRTFVTELARGRLIPSNPDRGIPACATLLPMRIGLAAAAVMMTSRFRMHPTWRNATTAAAIALHWVTALLIVANLTARAVDGRRCRFRRASCTGICGTSRSASRSSC